MAKLLRSATILVFGGIWAAGGCGGDACKKVCRQIDACLHPEAGSQTISVDPNAVSCPFEDTCQTPLQRCSADCILDHSSCAALLGQDHEARAAIALCQADCIASQDAGITPTPDDDVGGPQPDVFTWPAVDLGPGHDTSSCVPDCGGRQCGDDGCGGSCGSCTYPAVCNYNTGQCSQQCTPDCGGRQCGDDGCGGSCGNCTYPDVCDYSSGQCEDSCTPCCAGKQCGSDGCGGSCGSCTYPAVCDSNFQCTGSATSSGFGDSCDVNNPDCDAGLQCGGLDPTSTVGFCTKACSQPGSMCSGGPAGTMAACLLSDDTQTYYFCAFLCVAGGQTYTCPGQMYCSPDDNPPGSGQRACMP